MSFYNDNPFPSSCYMNGVNMDKDRQDEYFKMKVLESLRNQDNGKCTHCKRGKSPGDEEDYGTDSESDSDCSTDLSSATHGQGSVSKKAKSKKKRTSVKLGTPDDDELEELGTDIGAAWRKLGRRLKVTEAEITAIDKDNEDLVEKGYKTLLHWKQSNAEGASYQILYDALNHRLVARSDLAQKYCVE